MASTKIEYYDEDLNDSSGNFTDNWTAQTFTIGTVGTNKDSYITKVVLNMAKRGTPDPNLKIAIYSTTGGEPNTELASVTVDAGTFSTYPTFTTENFTITGITLSESTTYAIVVENVVGSSGVDDLRIENDTTGTYTGGNWYSTNDAGLNWTEQAGTDLKFEVWGKEKEKKAERGEKELKTDWPVEEGTDFGTTKQTGDRYLVAEEGSKVLSRNSELI